MTGNGGNRDESSGRAVSGTEIGIITMTSGRQWVLDPAFRSMAPRTGWQPGKPVPNAHWNINLAASPIEVGRTAILHLDNGEVYFLEQVASIEWMDRKEVPIPRQLAEVEFLGGYWNAEERQRMDAAQEERRRGNDVDEE